MYALGKAPAQSNDAYDVLQDVFGGSDFNEDESLRALMEVLDISADEAQRRLSALLSQDVIVEATQDVIEEV